MKPSHKLFFRRCHVCNELSFQKSKEDDLEQCEHCHKIFIPFLFFNDEETPVLWDNEPRPEAQESYLPIRGFTSYW